MADLSRRDLIAGAGALTLGLAGVRAIAQEPKAVGWAILGLGSYATRQILPNMQYCKLSKPVAVISGSPDKAKRIAAEYGIAESKIYNYQNMAKIADDPDIDVVYVITPPGTHKDFTVRALEAGKHVCCEKPMASSSKECEEMIAVAKRKNRRLQIGYRCHFEPHNLAAMELCKSGRLGKIRSVQSDHAFVMSWGGGWHVDDKLGGFGAISEIGVYAIQAMCYLIGEDPIEILGTRHKSNPELYKHVEDLNTFVLRFPGGAEGVGATAYSFNANNFRVYGNGGVLDAEPATGYGGHKFRLNGQPIEVTAANQWAAQMDHLSECVRNSSKTLIAPGEMGLRDIKIIEAVLRSAETKRAVPFA